jgi:hypothetical protein
MNTPWETVVDRYLDGTISADEMAELNARLDADGDARREFAQLLNVDSALAAIAAGEGAAGEAAGDSAGVAAGETTGAAEPSLASLVPVRRTYAFSTTPLRIALAASLLLSAAGSWWWFSGRTTATIVKEAGVPELAVGTSLGREPYVIEAGTIELVTARGAQVVIEAPAEFRFESADRLRMVRGRLSAEVPPEAKGFTVVTPVGEAVDLGTRFGIDVPASGSAELHVFEGEVVAGPSSAKVKQSYRGGDAVTLTRNVVTRRELRSGAFISRSEMSELTAGLAAGRRPQAEAALTSLKSDPALIGLFDFETGQGPPGNAADPGVFRAVQGRWPGSRAAEFVDVGDHLKLDVGGGRDYPQLTLAAWVRLDRLGAPYQSLLHTDGWNRVPGQVHWMVTRTATMRLALSRNTMAPGSEETEHPDSRTSVLPEQGRWMHLAVTYDSETGIVRFYLNGRFDKESRQAIAHPARLGPAQIGNWDRQDRKLSGRVDELLLLGRTLSDDEVRALFEAGNPYR